MTPEYNWNDLPKTERYQFDEDWGTERKEMEFRLIYKGRLPSQSASDHRAKEKHGIRKHFHKQLVELWQQHPLLRRELEVPVMAIKTPHNLISEPGPGVVQLLRGTVKDTGYRPWVEHIGDQFARCGYRFVPLVRKDNGLTCSLDILFLRRDNPGNLITSGGDIDNRIKVLFDGLRMPSSLNEIGEYKPEPHENPFFCLLENDDSLITGVSVTTDRLLLPREDTEQMHDVYLVIHVKTRATDPDALFADAHMI